MGALSRAEDLIRELLAFAQHEDGCPGNGGCKCELSALIQEANRVLDDGEEG